MAFSDSVLCKARGIAVSCVHFWLVGLASFCLAFGGYLFARVVNAFCLDARGTQLIQFAQMLLSPKVHQLEC